MQQVWIKERSWSKKGLSHCCSIKLLVLFLNHHISHKPGAGRGVGTQQLINTGAVLAVYYSALTLLSTILSESPNSECEFMLYIVPVKKTNQQGNDKKQCPCLTIPPCNALHFIDANVCVTIQLSVMIQNDDD